MRRIESFTRALSTIRNRFYFIFGFIAFANFPSFPNGDSTMGHVLPTIMSDEYIFEWKCKGKVISGRAIQEMELLPSDNHIDTIYYRQKTEGHEKEWSHILCKITKRELFVFSVNGCCGGFGIRPKNDRVKKKHIEFRLLESDGNIYLGRFGDAGIIMEKGKPKTISHPCEFNKSAMDTHLPVIRIEMIDTGQGLHGALERLDDASASDSLFSLSCFNNIKKGIEPGESGFSYYRYKIIKDIEFEWFDDQKLIISFRPLKQKIKLDVRKLK
jgi:hypothetical protein